MNRKITALLLAMAVILSTVAPTMAAAETGKAGTKTTASVSVEKPKKEKSKLEKLVAKVLGAKDVKDSDDEKAALKDAKAETSKAGENPAAGEDQQNKEPGTPKTDKFDISFIVKVDTEVVTGAKLKISKGDKEVGEPWDSEKAPKEFSLEPGAYKLEMTKAPDGYKAAKPIDFKVTDKGEIEGIDSSELKELETKEGKKVLVMKVEKEPEKEAEKIHFSLRYAADNKELTGAKLTITDDDDKMPKMVLTGERAVGTDLLKAGKYKFTAEALAGYKIKNNPIAFEIGGDGKIKEGTEFLEKTKDGEQILVMKAEKEAGKTFFGMRDSIGRSVVGVTLQIRERKDGTVRYAWKSEEGMVPRALEAGKYELVQVDVANGYTKAAPIAFDINDKGEITGLPKSWDGNQYLTMIVDYLENKTFFSLKDSRGNELAGVKLQIKEIGTERIVQQWESGKAPVDFKLDAGEYEFSQVNVLPGYRLASPIRFRVMDNKIEAGTAGLSAVGGQQVLALVNGFEKHEIKFRRVKSDGKDLAGTTIEIYKDGTRIAFWKSGTEANKLELEPGIYKYHEVGILDGHKKVADFEFEVKANGTVTLGAVQIGDTVKLKEDTIIVSGGTENVESTNKPKEQKKDTQTIWVEFSLTKRSGGELSGAIVEIYQGSTMVESWTSKDLSHLTQLKPGIYRFHVKTPPTGFAAPKDFNFTVKQGGVALGSIPAGQTVTVKDRLITVLFETKAAAAATKGSGVKNGKKSNLPKTGDGISPVVYAVALGVVGAATLGIGMKKRKEEIDEAK